MKSTTTILLVTSSLYFLASYPAFARLFTDNQGRQVEAELVGVQGQNAVLSRNGRLGQWPVSKLSEPDRVYVRAWAKKPRSTPKLSVHTTEKDGIGPAGEFSDESPFPGPPTLAPPENVPGILQTQKTASYHHGKVTLTNSSTVDANHLTFAYTLYVIRPDGRVVSESDSAKIESIPAGKGTVVHTKGMSSESTKAKSLTVSGGSDGSFTTGSQTTRNREEFGGTWVRIYGADGTIVGESKRLTRDLQKIDPAWDGPKSDSQIPLLDALDSLIGEIIKRIPEAPKDLPPRPKLPPFPR